MIDERTDHVNAIRRARVRSLIVLIVPVLLAIGAASGCRPAAHEEAEHHAPEHMPANFPAAVERLQELHREIIDGERRVATQLDVYAEAYDIAGWLPVLAADSDLKEAPWNRVYQASQRMESILEEVRAAPASGRRASYSQRSAELDALSLELSEIKQLFDTEPH